ncbi:hypothetical protein AB5J62_22010 [Amycolatopsis sp. cg5]|uniref:hypothetical protein n=1 Tax=Amycolatopsis sp. cg5 TaxID=3238802 RepID=UPI003523D80C
MRNRILPAIVAVGVSAGMVLTGLAGTAGAQTAGVSGADCRSAAVGSTFTDVCFTYVKEGDTYNSQATVRYATADASAYLSADGLISHQKGPYWLAAYPGTKKPTVFKFKVCNKQNKCSAWT